MKTWSFPFLSFLVLTLSCLSFDYGVSQSEEAKKNKFREREATDDTLDYPNFDEDVNKIHQNPEKEEKKGPMFSDEDFFNYTLLALFLITPPTFLSLLFLSAPYGKHRRPGWGPTIPPPLAWCLMESPTVWLTLLLFPHGKNGRNARALVLISPFLLHYLHRTLVYPLRLLLKTPGGRMIEKKSGFPVSIAAMAFGFNLLNAYLQSRWVSEYADLESDGWFWPRMAAGAAVFVGGVVVNVRSDNMLMGLKESGGGYKIPRGGLFEWVSCPNYLGEIVEWLGWALMTWSWAGLGFFLYTCANLVPRVGQNHRWYLEKFGEDYPRDRKAVIPFVY